MRILVDTSAWSASLRRTKRSESLPAQELRNLIADHSVEIIGPIRQEILSGIREEGSNTDFLISAVAVRCRCAIYTTDEDFHSFAKHLPIALHEPK
jgi:predicted nucleic acid-binding protein